MAEEETTVASKDGTQFECQQVRLKSPFSKVLNTNTGSIIYMVSSGGVRAHSDGQMGWNFMEQIATFLAVLTITQLPATAWRGVRLPA